jgi:L-gulonolactone oxidase
MFFTISLLNQVQTDFSLFISREKTGEAIHELKAWLDSQDSTVVAHFPVEVRFSKADDINLSPAFGRDTAYINILLYR